MAEIIIKVENGIVESVYSNAEEDLNVRVIDVDNGTHDEEFLEELESEDSDFVKIY